MATTKKTPVTKKTVIKKTVAAKKDIKSMNKNMDEDEQIKIFDFDDNNDVIPSDEDEDVVVEAKKKEISQAGYNKLKRLEEHEIPSVNDRIKEAREFGDLSENAEYQSALNEKQMLDMRIAELKEIIVNSLIVDTIKK